MQKNACVVAYASVTHALPEEEMTQNFENIGVIGCDSSEQCETISLASLIQSEPHSFTATFRTPAPCVSARPRGPVPGPRNVIDVPERGLLPQQELRDLYAPSKGCGILWATTSYLRFLWMTTIQIAHSAILHDGRHIYSFEARVLMRGSLVLCDEFMMLFFVDFTLVASAKTV